MKFMVTGGAGFIGSAVVRHILADTPHEVVNLDVLTYAANPLTISELDGEGRHILLRADIADGEAVNAAFALHRPDFVIHLAAESHVDRSTNVVGTFTMLDAAKRYWETLGDAAKAAFRFVHVSTDEVYGSLGEQGEFSEDSPYAPNSPYAASKASSDHLARAWHVTFGLPVVTTNCSNNYGPRQFPEKLIPLLVMNGLAGLPLPIYGDGLNVRDWLYVEDHARALVDVALRAAPGARYMIGGGTERTNLEIVQEVCAILDELRPDGAGPRKRLITHVKDRPGHDRRYAADFSRVQRELGWQPRETLETGLARTVRWYLDNPQWCAACGDTARRRQGLEEKATS